MQGSVTDKKIVQRSEKKEGGWNYILDPPLFHSSPIDMSNLWVENRGKRTKNASVLQHSLGVS